MNPRLLRPKASGFNLRSLAGLVQWYDAADQSTMTLNGSTVSEWRSKVGGVAVSQATASAQPTLTQGYYSGRSALTFDGGDFLSNATLPMQVNGFSAAIVFDETTRVSFAGLLVGIPPSGSDSSTAGGFRWSVHEGANRPTELFASVTNNLDMRGPVISEASALGKSVAVATISPSSSGSERAVMRLNGTAGAEDALYSAPINTTGTLIGGRYQSGAVDASYRFNGRILEVAIWNRALNASERDAVEGYLAWKWGLQGNLPYNHPYASAFPGFGSQSVPTDADTLTYLNAVATADGAAVEVKVANAVQSFIVGCKADGIWDAMKAAVILCGARSLSGALVPLKGTAPTNNNFVAGDYARTTGLLGNVTTKFLDTNRAGNADPQNSFHAAVFASTVASGGVRVYSGSGLNASGSFNFFVDGGTAITFRNRTAGSSSFAGGASAAGLIGTSRASSASYVSRAGGTSQTNTATSETPVSQNIFMYALNNSGASFHANARLAYYSIGESIDLALLDARVSALVTAIGAS
jgi:hypothetical protein